MQNLLIKKGIPTDVVKYVIAPMLMIDEGDVMANHLALMEELEDHMEFEKQKKDLEEDFDMASTKIEMKVIRGDKPYNRLTPKEVSILNRHMEDSRRHGECGCFYCRTADDDDSDED